MLKAKNKWLLKLSTSNIVIYACRCLERMGERIEELDIWIKNFCEMGDVHDSLHGHENFSIYHVFSLWFLLDG